MPALHLLLALLVQLGAAVGAGRIEIPFGRGWRWHRGDAPDGPGLGSGALSGFHNVTSCTNTQKMDGWAPQGDKSAGYPPGVTSCNIACSYDDSCTAFSDGPGYCAHGFADAVCNGTGGPPPAPPAPSGPCNLTLTQKSSNMSSCTAGTSYGCETGHEEMWVDKGCSGEFSCNGHAVHCVSHDYQRTYCRCAVPAGVHVMQRGHPFGSPHVMQRGPGAGFQRNFSFAQTDFDDTSWKTATLPHDPLINQTFDPTAGEGSGFVPRKVIWYRKTFVLPEELRGQHIFLRFDGAFQFSEVYLNGAHLQDHSTGYVSWTCRLDNASSLSPGRNILAMRVDPSFGSGHWCAPLLQRSSARPSACRFPRSEARLCSDRKRQRCLRRTTRSLPCPPRSSLTLSLRQLFT